MGFDGGPIVTISYEKLKIILPQVHKYIFKIINNKINQTVYLSKIPFPDSNSLKFVLIVIIIYLKSSLKKKKPSNLRI